MEVLNNFKIKSKIIIIIFIIGALSAIIGNVINYIYEVNYSKGRLIANTILQAKLISENCWVPIEFNYKKNATEVLAKLNAIPDIYDAVLYTSNDSIFAVYHKSENKCDKINTGLKSRIYLIEGNFLHIKQAVIHQDKVYGYIYLRTFIDWSDIIYRRLGMTIIIIISMLVIVLVLANILQRYISGPIIKLTCDMEAVSKNRNYTIRYNKNGKDEISELYKGFNSMLEKINQREIDINKAYESLKESESRYRRLHESMTDCFVQISLTGKIIDANRSYIEMLGYSKEELLLISSSDITPETWNQAEQTIIETEVLQSGFSPVYEKEYIKKDKTIFPVELRTYLLRDNEGHPSGMWSIVRDITEKKKTEAELLKHRTHLESLVFERTEELASTNEELISTNEELYYQKEQLQAAMKKLNDTQNQLIHSEKMASLGVLSAGVAHEINNPLNFINGGILGIETYCNNNLQDHLPALNPLINAVNVGIKRATEIVSSLSHYNRKDDLPKIECDLNSILDNCLVMLQNQLKNKIAITKQYSKEPCLVFGSEGKLHQAMLNIIANANQAIDQKGDIDILTEINQNIVIITITDTGCGISQENLPKIFDPFYTTKVTGKGTGLGLSITYNIIKEHNGSIVYESKPTKGTKVKITFPYYKTEKHEQ